MAFRPTIGADAARMGIMTSLPEVCRPDVGRAGSSPPRGISRHTERVRRLLVLGVVLLVAACAGRRSPASGPDPSSDRGTVEPGWEQTGLASWYGEPFHGRATASGERYDQEGLTAAHRSLPFGTWVRVENLENGRSVRVRVTDRGPFVDDRIIDLSRAAARALGLIGPGTGRVRLEVVEVSGCHAVQVASFSDRETALQRRGELEEEGTPAFLESGPGGTTRVLVGPYPDRGAAERRRDEHGGWLRPCPDLDGPAEEG